MPIAAADLQRLAVLRVGDFSDNLLANNVAVIWALYPDKAQIAPRLQLLYVQLDLIDLALGRVREQVDLQVTTDQGAKLAEKFAHLQQMRVNVLAEITKVENRTAMTQTAATGLLVNTAPVMPPNSGVPNAQPTYPLYPYGDANDPSYSGSPYISGRDS